MSISPLSSALPAAAQMTPDSPKKDSPEKIKDAASQFEALLMGQILKAAHEENGDGWGDEESDQASATAKDFANEYFARSLASTGGLGLSKMIAAGLNRESISRSSLATKPELPANTPPNDR